jgi:hypothetical protein
MAVGDSAPRSRPGASGFESHRRGRIFSKEGTSAGPWMCVYVFQGLTVGWWKEERHSSDTTARSAGFESQAMDVCVCIRVVASRKRRKCNAIINYNLGRRIHHIKKIPLQEENLGFCMRSSFQMF